jgi:two-component system sensor histidine kinase KdpD
MRLSDHAIALVAVAVVVALLRLASPLANTTTVALCLVVVVLFVARTRSGPAALVASLASMLALNFFFLPPVGTLTIADPLNWIALAAFLAVALTVGELSSRANRQTAQARAHQLEAERLYRELQAAVDREAQTEAERRSERLKSALLDAVTHNLRTPITSIKASTTALLSESATMGDAIKRELLVVANEEADRLDLLVEDLISLARIEAGELGLQVSWCSLEDVVGGASKRAERLFGARTLDVTLPPDLPVIRADARALEEVLFQLLENASKYSPRESRISVSAREETDERIEIRVEDEGPGVALEERERIFDKFYRSPATETTASGSGLGLAIVRGIVEAHRGQVAVTDREGQPGARFIVRLPIGDEDNA